MSKTIDSYIFRPPHMKMRAEEFGGIAQAQGALYILNISEFNTLLSFDEYMSKELAQQKIGNEMLESFLIAGLFLEISQDDAQNTIKERG